MVPIATTTTLTSLTPNPAIFAQTATFTASVTPSSGTLPSNVDTVTFQDGGAAIGTATLVGGTATFQISTLSIGSHSITAVFNGDSTYQTSMSAAQTEVVNQDTTKTKVSSSANPSYVGQSVTLTATVSSPATTATVQSNYISGLNSPFALAIDSSGNIYVGLSSGTVSQYSPTGALINASYITGLTGPPDLAFDSSGNFYATNGGAVDTVSKYSPTGALINASYISGNSPTDMAFDSSGNLYVSNFINGTVSKYSPTGALINASYLTGLKSPHGLAFDSAGNLYVANDTGYGTVSEYSPTGALINPSCIPGLQNPYNLAFDSSGDIFVVDDNANTSPTVYEYSSTGARITASFLPSSIDPQQLAFDSSGNLFVTNSGGSVAKVAFPLGPTIPSGETVTFQDNGVAIGTGTLNGSDVATFTTSSLALGNHSITAVYGGDSGFLASTSTPVLTQTVNKIPTTTTLTTSGSPTSYGQSVTFTATVARAVDVQPTYITGASPSSALAIDSAGNIYFGNGSQVSQYSPTGALINASYITGVFGPSDLAFDSSGNLYVGDVSGNRVFQYSSTGTLINATYISQSSPKGLAFDSSGNLYDGNDLTNTVSKYSPTGALINASYITGLNDPAALAFDSAGNLYVANQTGNGTVSKYSPTGALINASYISGLYYPFSLAFDSSGDLFVDNTGTVTNTLSEYSPTGALINAALLANISAAFDPHQLAFDSSGHLYVSNGSGSVAKISFSTGPVVPSGETVTFKDNGVAIGTGTLNGSGVAQFTASSLALGSHSITAVYGGDANFATSTSPVLIQNVVNNSTTTTLTTSASPSFFGQSVTFTSTVSSVAAIPSGETVTFEDNGVSIGTAALNASDVASFSTLTLAGGSHTITAVYSGDSNYATSTSPALTQTVNLDSTTTTVSSSANPSYVGQSVTFNATVSTPATTATLQSSFITGLFSAFAFAIDSSGNFYVGNSGVVAKYSPTGALINASFITGLNGPTALAIDSSGNIYAANNNSNGTVSQYSPTGTLINASFISGVPNHTALAFDTAGNLYIANDPNYGTVSKYSPTGALLNGSYINGIAAINANTGLAFDSAGNLYVVNDTNYGTVSKYSPTGAIINTSYITGLWHPSSLAFDPSGDLFVLNNPTSGFTLNEYSSTGALISPSLIAGASGSLNARTLAFDSSGNLYFTNQFGSVSKLTFPTGPVVPSGDTVTFQDNGVTIGTAALNANDVAQFTTSTLGLGSQSITAVYGGDAGFKSSTSTAVLTQTVAQFPTTTTLTTSGVPTSFGQSATFTATVSTPATTATVQANFITVSNSANAATAVAIDSAGNVYVANGNNGGNISKYSPTGALINAYYITGLINPTVLAFDSSGNLDVLDDGLAFLTYSSTGALINPNYITLGTAPNGFAFDSSGNLYLNNGYNNTVNKYSPTGALLKQNYISAGGNGMYGMAFDPAGNLYIVNDSFTGTVSKYSPTGALINASFISGLWDPTYIAINSSGDIFVLNNPNSGPMLSEYSSTGALINASLLANASGSFNPKTLTIDSSGNLYFTNGNGTVSKITFPTGPVVPSGEMVTFQDNGVAIGTAALNASGVASFTTSTLELGSHSITAVYGGDANLATSTSSPAQTQTVNQDTTTAVLSPLSSPSTFGQSVTFTATISSTHGQVIPSGETVTFQDNGSTIGTGTLNASDVATFTTSTLAVGAHSITAVYGGDANFLTSPSSPALIQTVNQDTTTTVLSPLSSPSSYGQSVTFTATISSTHGQPIASGETVIFLDNGSTIGTGTLNGSDVATFTTSTLAVGAHTITAVYGGDANFLTSTSASAQMQTVNADTTTTALATSGSPSYFAQSVTFTATIGSTHGQFIPSGETVTFQDNGVSIGTGTLNSSDVATFTTLTLSVGSHTITAVYLGDANFLPSTSVVPLTQTVNTAATVSQASNSSIAYSPNAQVVTLNATLSDASVPADRVNEGMVTFTVENAGGTVIGSPVTGAVSNNAASAGYSLPAATALGSYTIIVSYSDSPVNFIDGGDVAGTLQVTPEATQFAVVALSNTTFAGQAFLYTVQAEDSGGNPTSYSGAVSFTTNDPQVATLPSGTLNSNGFGFFIATLKTVTTSGWTITATTGTATGQSSAITVSPGQATHFVVATPSSTLTLNSTTFTVTAYDPYNNVATGYSGMVHFTSSDGAVSTGSGLPANSTLVNGTGTFTATLKTPGNQTITATDASNNTIVGNSNGIATRGLYVSSFATTPSGFTATFSKVVNLTTLDYYRFSASQSQAPDVAMATVGSTTTNVNGTLLVSSTATQTTITFVATQGALTNAAGYLVSLTSGAGGIVDTSGEQLAGDANGFLPGTNYVATNLVPASSTTPTLSIPGFARGPNSTAAVQITSNSVSAAGIPITLTHAPASTTEVQFTLNFNPALLNVTGPTSGTFTLLNPGTANSTGVANFEYSGPALSTTSAVLGDIVADVPNSAANQMLQKTLLDLPAADIYFNGSATPASPVQNADGVQMVDYLGETTNNFGVINSVDASNAQAVVTANTTPTTANQPAGLQAFPLADPYLIAGSTGSTTFKVVAADVTGLNRFAVSLSHPFIPTPPTGLTYSSPGPDPTLSLPTNLQVTAGGIVTVPVNIDDPRPAGSDGMTQAELALTYDPSVFSLTSADVQLGTVPASGTGWTLTTQINPLTGQIAILLESQTPIRSAEGGSLVSIDFHVNPGATLGATPVNLAASVNPTGNATVWTRLFDSQQEFTLSPAPSNAVSAAGLDAMVVVTLADALASAGTAEGGRGTNSTVTTVVDDSIGQTAIELFSRTPIDASAASPGSAVFHALATLLASQASLSAEPSWLSSQGGAAAGVGLTDQVFSSLVLANKEADESPLWRVRGQDLLLLRDDAAWLQDSWVATPGQELNTVADPTPTAVQEQLDRCFESLADQKGPVVQTDDP